MIAATAAANEIMVFAGRAIRRFFRDPSLVIAGFGFPMLMLFIQIAVFGKVIDAAIDGDYVDRIVPLVVLTTAAFAAGGSAAGFYQDVHNGLLNRLRTMPIHSRSPMAGKVLGDVVRIVIVAVAATLVGHLAGFRFAQGPLAAIGFFGVVALFGVMITWLALLAALTLETIAMIETAVGSTATLLFFLSSGFVPLDAFPAFLQPFVRVNPFSVVTEALMGLSSGGPVAVPLFQTLAWTLGASALCAFLAVRRYRRLATP